MDRLASSSSGQRQVRLDLFDPTVGHDRGRSRPTLAAWYLCKWFFFLTAFPWPSGLKRRLLVIFGAEVGKGLHMKPRVNVHFPWKLRMGEHCWVGERTEILNLETVTMGSHVALAHDVYIAAAGHDITSPVMDFKNRPVVIEDGCWIATRVFIGPGVRVGHHAVAAACAVLVKDVAPYAVMGGNPAKQIGVREIRPPGDAARDGV